MSLETVEISVGGRMLTDWQSIVISVSTAEAVRSGSLALHVAPGDDPPWPGQKVTVKAGGNLLLTGYVRDFAPRQDEEDWSATLTFVSRTVDAVECSIVHPTGRAENKDIAGIAREFDTCGVGIEVVGSFEKHERHQIVPGETLYDTIEPLAFADGALIHDTPEGKLKITGKPDGDHAGGLAIGVNIISGSAAFTEHERFDPVMVRGQQSRGKGAEALRPQADAGDKSAGRYRPKIIVLDSEATASRLTKAAEWQARRAAGRAVTADIVVKGWRDEKGKIWTPNFRVHVSHPRLYLDQMMAISAVRLEQDATEGSQGTIAMLSLVDPRALGGQAAGGKSGDGWSAPEPKAKYGAA